MGNRLDQGVEVVQSEGLQHPSVPQPPDTPPGDVHQEQPSSCSLDDSSSWRSPPLHCSSLSQKRLLSQRHLAAVLEPSAATADGLPGAMAGAAVSQAEIWQVVPPWRPHGGSVEVLL